MASEFDNQNNPPAVTRTILTEKRTHAEAVAEKANRMPRGAAKKLEIEKPLSQHEG